MYKKITKGNIPVYLSVGLSIIISLVSFAFVSTTAALRSDVDKNQDDIFIISKDVSGLKADNVTMEKWLTRIEGKLDKVIAQ